MIELIIAVATLAVIIMGWGYMKKSFDWVGARVGETTDMLSDVTNSGSYQTRRGVVISRDSLSETMSDTREKVAKRQVKEAKFMAGLSPEQLKAVAAEDKFMNALLNR